LAPSGGHAQSLDAAQLIGSIDRARNAGGGEALNGLEFRGGPAYLQRRAAARGPMRQTFDRVREFLNHEAAGGGVLLAAAALAILIANSPLAPFYDVFLDIPMTVRIGALVLDKPLLLWINDGLMAIFFFLVGLEIKREFLEGELASLDRALLPLVAAIGGIVVPALIYAAFNWSDPAALRGWAIPAATDIAFAVGVLALLGSRVPLALKVFLLAVAIFDDLGAIVIIALFYTSDLSLNALVLAGFGGLVLLALNLTGQARIVPYVLVGIFIWVCVLKSGVHATLAGVLVAIAVPLKVVGKTPYSPLHQAEEGLHPWVAFGVLPLFAFANAGVSLADLSAAKLMESIPLGIALGLIVGKQVGILAATAAMVGLSLCRLPQGTTWLQIYGVSAVAGIGFTMSLFIGTLALSGPGHAVDVRVGVIAGSLVSALIGYLVLRSAAAQVARTPAEGASRVAG
jgi:NhaA family Na+:H+ antiporter